MKNIHRREFIKETTMAGIPLPMLNNPVKSFAGKKKTTVRIGMIAVGLRGQLHLSEMLKRNDVEIIAMADPDKRMMGMAQQLVKQSGRKAPVEYGNVPYDYKSLLKRNDIDAVFISSPWEWHIPQGVDAMNAGKIVGMEVSGAIKLQDCWDIVNTHEKTKVPMVLENVCYHRDIMAVPLIIRRYKILPAYLICCHSALIEIQG